MFLCTDENGKWSKAERLNSEHAERRSRNRHDDIEFSWCSSCLELARTTLGKIQRWSGSCEKVQVFARGQGNKSELVCVLCLAQSGLYGQISPESD